MEDLSARPTGSIPVASGVGRKPRPPTAYWTTRRWNGAKSWRCIPGAPSERLRASGWRCAFRTPRNWISPASRGLPGLGPLSDLRQHGLYVLPLWRSPRTACRWGAGHRVLACDRATLGDDQRHWPIEAKESMRWLEGFERCAEWSATLSDTRLVYAADRECNIHECIIRARRWPGPRR